MGEALQGIKPLFDKLAELFGVFDLSFFVSGAVTVGGVLLAEQQLDVFREPVATGGERLAVVIVGAYVAGLFNFAIGRNLRRRRARALVDGADVRSPRLRRLVEEHGLDRFDDVGDLVRAYEEARSSRERPAGTPEPDLDALNVRLWAELRQDRRYAPSLAFLNHYWMLAATYDGLAVAVWSWFPGLLLWICGKEGVEFPEEFLICVTVAVLLFALTCACCREASRYDRYQDQELVATIATVRAPLADDDEEEPA